MITLDDLERVLDEIADDPELKKIIEELGSAEEADQMIRECMKFWDRAKKEGDQ